MPLMTRRSSARDTRTSVGKCCSIRSHCSSLSQNRFLRTVRYPPKKKITPYEIRIILA